MNTFIFTKKAQKKLLNLQKSTQSRITGKLKELKKYENILSTLKRLHHFESASHRLRIGNYRLIMELKEQKKEDLTFWILDLGDRKNIYK